MSRLSRTTATYLATQLGCPITTILTLRTIDNRLENYIEGVDSVLEEKNQDAKEIAFKSTGTQTHKINLAFAKIMNTDGNCRDAHELCSETGNRYLFASMANSQFFMVLGIGETSKLYVASKDKKFGYADESLLVGLQETCFQKMNQKLPESLRVKLGDQKYTGIEIEIPEVISTETVLSAFKQTCNELTRKVDDALLTIIAQNCVKH